MTSLAKRAIKGLLGFQLFVAMLLFAAAGTWQYWPGWLYWSLFGLCNAANSLYFVRYDPALVEHRMAVGPLAEPRRAQKIIQSLMSVLLCSMYIIGGLDWRFSWSRVIWPIVILGNVLLVLSYVAIFVVFRQNRYASAIVEVQAEQPVIDRGLYSLVRHPMYTASVLMFAGTGLALASYWSLLLIVPIVGLLVARILDEERCLRESLVGYDGYCQRVRYRLLPGVW